jgi:hypothetical protein
MQSMSYLDKREGLPPCSDEFLNQVFESYYCSKIKRQADEILSLKIQLQQLRREQGEPELEIKNIMPVRSYCGQDFDEQEQEQEFADDVFYNIGAAMVAQSEQMNRARIPMEDMVYDGDEAEAEVQEDRADKYNASCKMQNLAIFLKHHYDMEQCNEDNMLECVPLKRSACGDHEKECVEWLMSDEATYWFLELFQRPWFLELFQRPVQKREEILKEARAEVEDAIQRTSSLAFCEDDEE